MYIDSICLLPFQDMFDYNTKFVKLYYLCKLQNRCLTSIHISYGCHPRPDLQDMVDYHKACYLSK